MTKNRANLYPSKHSSVNAWLLLILLSLVKLWLMQAPALGAVAGSIYDDELFLRLAQHILHGEWLGPYNHLTLIKGPMYPLWIAGTFILGIPLLSAQNLLYIAAGLVLLRALRHHLSLWVLMVLFALFLFNVEIPPRVLRAGIYPALTVLVLAAFAGLYAHRDTPRRAVGWGILAGLTLAAFWLTREEGIWLLPSVLLLAGWTLWRLFRHYGRSQALVLRCVPLLLPFVLAYAGVSAVALLNGHYYGVRAVVEFNTAPYRAALGALQRVEHPRRQAYLPVPGEVRAQIYAVSPAFRALQPHLEGEVGWRWQLAVNCGYYPHTCGDLAGTYLSWGLRDAAAQAGYHRSGSAAMQYYTRLAAEINGACDHGRLACLPERHSLMPPWQWEYLDTIWPSLLKNSAAVAGYTYFPDSLPQLMRQSGRADLIYLLPKHAHLFSDMPAAHSHQDILDIARIVGNVSSLADFPYSVGDADGLALFADLTRSPLVPREGGQALPNQARLDAFKITVLKHIAQAYGYFLPVAVMIALGLYLLQGISIPVTRQVSFLFVFNSALLGAVCARLLILAVVEAMSFQTFFVRYFAPLYPLLLIFVVTAIAGFEPGASGAELTKDRWRTKTLVAV